MDGLGFAETKIMAERKIQVEPSISFSSFEQIHKALDQFYSDYKNELIPASLALKVLSMELKEESKEAVEKELQRMRRQVQDERKK